jgi:hypothetical protein
MDPNVKLLVEGVAKQLWVDIKEGFMIHEAAFTKRLVKVTIAECLCDACHVNLEEVATSIDKALTEWRPEVDASISSVKLKLSKLNSFFARESPTGSQQGILTTRSAPVTSSAAADGPNGHRVAPYHRDYEFGRVFTQIHDPVKGTVQTPSPPSNSVPRLEFPHGVESLPWPNSLGRESRVPLGKLPKMNFPKFENKNPKL